MYNFDAPHRWYTPNKRILFDLNAGVHDSVVFFVTTRALAPGFWPFVIPLRWYVISCVTILIEDITVANTNARHTSKEVRSHYVSELAGCSVPLTVIDHKLLIHHHVHTNQGFRSRHGWKMMNWKTGGKGTSEDTVEEWNGTWTWYEHFFEALSMNAQHVYRESKLE